MSRSRWQKARLIVPKRGGASGPGGGVQRLTALERGIERDLTEHQLKIAQLIADGLTAPEVGEKLWLSEETIKHHKKVLRRYTRKRTTTAAVVELFRRGLIE